MANLAPSVVQQVPHLDALETVFAQRFTALEGQRVLVMLVDVVPENMLPLLAEQWDLTGDAGYNLATTADARRALVKDAIKIHRIHGTPAAIERAFALIGLHATVTEWFEYGGQPGYFKVSAIQADAPSSAQWQQMRRLIRINQNVRSWLEAISVQAQTVGGDTYTGAGSSAAIIAQTQAG